MTCDEAEVLLHALIDGELDAGHAREVETHVAGCARCAAQLASIAICAQAIAGRQPALHRARQHCVERIDRAVPQPTARSRIGARCSRVSRWARRSVGGWRRQA